MSGAEAAAGRPGSLSGGEAERVARHLSEAQELSVRLFRRLLRSASEDIDSAIDEVLADIGRFSGVDRAYLFRFAGTGRMYNSHEWVSEGVEPVRHLLGDLPLSLLDDWMPLLQDDRPVIIADVAALPEARPYRQLLVDQAIHSLVAVPVSEGGRLAGFVGFDAVRKPKLFLEAEVNVLRSTADVIGAVLSRATAEAEAAAALRQLGQTTLRLRTILDAVPELVMEFDSSGICREAATGRPDAWPMSPAAMLGHRPEDIMPAEVARAVRRMMLAVDTGARDVLQAGRFATGSGMAWLEASAVRCPAIAPGDAPGYLLVVRNATRLRQTEEELNRLGQIAAIMTNLVVMVDPQQRITYVNRAFEKQTGYQIDEVLGRRYGDVLRRPEVDAGTARRVAAAIAGREPFEGEAINFDRHGRPYHIRFNTQPLFDAEGGYLGHVSIETVITEEKELGAALAAERDRLRLLAEEARRAAEEDALTGLPNRRKLGEILAEAAEAVRRGAGRFALMMIDLDNFKSVNDTLRHQAGDEVLIEIARRMREVMGAEGTVARLGGDEFVALVPVAGLERAAAFAAALRVAIARPVVLDLRKVYVTASIGIAMCPADGQDAAELLSAADMALATAKAGGRDRAAMVTHGARVAEGRRSALIQALSDSVGSDHFRLAFQPQFLLDGGQSFRGAEALVRWTSPILGEVGPAEFVPVAEAAGLAGRLDDLVLALAARQMGEWARAGRKVPLSVNLSARSFADPMLARRLIDILLAHWVDPALLTVEITESALMGIPAAAEGNVRRLRRAGVGIAVDDFGTGFSSLSYLRQLSVTELKIDRSFVSGLGDPGLGASSEPIVKAVLLMCRELGIRSFAEGVEGEGQLDWLRAHGCDGVQGFLYGAAMEASAFTAWLDGRTPAWGVAGA